MATVNDISSHQQLLIRTLRQNGASLIGFGDVSAEGSELTRSYPLAISIGVEYDRKIVKALHIDENAFHQHLKSLNPLMAELINIAENLLAEWGYQYMTPPLNNPIKGDKQLRELKAFPHKTGATCAGLGWIGKCALLLTPEYGPRIKLGTVLTNAEFKTADPITGNRCGECSLCAEACPYGAVNNVNWEVGVERGKLFDAYLCNEKRLSFIPVIGRKHECALCLQACPVGK